MIFGVALLRQLGIKGVTSFSPLRINVPETDARNLAGAAALFRDNNGLLIR
jgi:hypothetical protein